MRLHAAVLVFVLGLGLLACGSTPKHTVTLVNKSPRPIAELYVYPPGAANPGASRGRLEPNARTSVSVAEGAIEVRAVTIKERLDDVTSESKEASQVLQVKGPLEVVFHDATQNPPELARKDAVGVTFRVLPKPAAAEAPSDEPADEPSEAPADEPAPAP